MFTKPRVHKSAMTWTSLQRGLLSGHVRNSKVVFESKNVEKKI